MTRPKIYIDGVLKTWGDRLYPEPVQMKRTKKGLTLDRIVPRTKPAQKTTSGATRTRKTLAMTTKKVPEVMVKITGGGKGMKVIRAHLDYISRNGKEPLETELGEIVEGRDAIKELREDWEYGAFGVIPEESNQRQAFNIILSMPAGTDRVAVHNAAREFAREQFGDRKYVFASHHDEPHPHVHICVAARGFDGTRLNPRKAVLQAWRESFAEHLREHGIEANATRRQARGITKTPVPQPVVNMKKKRKQHPKYYRDPASRPNPGNPYADKQAVTQRTVIEGYRQMAAALVESEDAEDWKQALKIVELVKSIPAFQAMFQQPQTQQMAQEQPPRAQKRTRVPERSSVPPKNQKRDDRDMDQ